MIPVDQTLMHSDTQFGNCFAACIASILELDIEDVPNFSESITWLWEVNDWLKQYGLYYLDFNLYDDMRSEISVYFGYHILTGDSLRGCRHSVVAKAGKMIHDPHPSRDGLIGDKFGYGFIISLNPSI